MAQAQEMPALETVAQSHQLGDSRARSHGELPVPVGLLGIKPLSRQVYWGPSHLSSLQECAVSPRQSSREAPCHAPSPPLQHQRGEHRDKGVREGVGVPPRVSTRMHTHTHARVHTYQTSKFSQPSSWD